MGGPGGGRWAMTDVAAGLYMAELLQALLGGPGHVSVLDLLIA